MALTPSKPKILRSPSSDSDIQFHLVDGQINRRRLVVLVQGERRTGKSHLALTAPGPIYYQGLDVGAEVANMPDKPWAGKVIHMANYNTSFPPNTDEATLARECNRMWDQFVANQQIAVTKGRTAVIDTESELWELFRVARSGRTNPEKQAYMVISPEYRGVLRSFYQSDCNLIMIAKLKDEWKGNKSTGVRKRAGFGDADYLAQIVVETWKRDGEYGLTVIDCRLNPAIEGMEIPNDFVTLATLVHPDSEEADWQ